MSFSKFGNAKILNALYNKNFTKILIGRNKGSLIFSVFLVGSGLVASSFYLDFYKKNEKENFDFNNYYDLTKNIFAGFLTPQVLLAKENESQPGQSIIITPRQKLFFQFASIEYDGIPYMTPQDFLESVTEDHPRPRIRRKILTKEQYKSFLKNTPARKYGSNRLFRNLEDKGLISYSEYLFLLCVITKPNSDFEIAFNMFDTDGNQRVDKKEFLVVAKIFQRDSEPKQVNKENGDDKSKMFGIFPKKILESLILAEPFINVDTTLLVHLFGEKGNGVLKFENFKKFMEDLQKEVLEIEFNEFSKGMNKISSIEFAEILLRYTDFNQEKRLKLIKKLQSKINAYSREISFEKFLQFSQFMMNLADFQLALKFHTYANKAISREELQRAVKISSGFTLDPQIVEVIFQVFDENGDGELSYREFISVLKGRLNRGLKSKKRHIYEFSTNKQSDLFNNASLYSQSDIFITNDQEPSFMKKFKSCLRKKMREKNYD
ncbi:unnamed protein product [Brachionus calyciflorus]|uniref:EF-hand domain-containing protein n=1 Tax=Brachionus calyciflorus TaxID=104777 RepID=A0A813LYA1_9BILA|nr:unnamed protein product [Brachionus calyciflorus]